MALFGSLFRQAQATVETSIGQAVDRAVLAVPFIVAGGFVTAAIAAYVIRVYGTELGSLIMALVFVLVGLVVMGAQSAKRPHAASRNTATDAVEPAEADTSPPPDEPMSKTDRELLFAVLTSGAPILAPQLFKMIARNLPLLAAIVAALFIMTRPPQEHSDDATGTDAGGAGLAPAE